MSLKTTPAFFVPGVLYMPQDRCSISNMWSSTKTNTHTLSVHTNFSCTLTTQYAIPVTNSKEWFLSTLTPSILHRRWHPLFCIESDTLYFASTMSLRWPVAHLTVFCLPEEVRRLPVDEVPRRPARLNALSPAWQNASSTFNDMSPADKMPRILWLDDSSSVWREGCLRTIIVRPCIKSL